MLKKSDPVLIFLIENFPAQLAISLPSHPTFAVALPGEKEQTKYYIFIKSSTKSKLHKNAFFHIFCQFGNCPFSTVYRKCWPIKRTPQAWRRVLCSSTPVSIMFCPGQCRRHQSCFESINSLETLLQNSQILKLIGC